MRGPEATAGQDKFGNGIDAELLNVFNLRAKQAVDGVAQRNDFYGFSPQKQNEKQEKNPGLGADVRDPTSIIFTFINVVVSERFDTHMAV